MLHHATEETQAVITVVDANDDGVLAALLDETHRRRRGTHNLRFWTGLAVIFLAGFEFFHYLRTGKLDMGFLVPAMLLSTGITIGASKALAKAVRQAAPLQDPASFEPMIEVLNSGDAELKAVATECLMRLLPRVEPSQYELLSAEQRTMFHKVLFETTNPEVAETFGSEVARLGSKTAVPILEAFCNGKTALKGASRDRALGNVRLHLADLRIELARARIEAGP